MQCRTIGKIIDFHAVLKKLKLETFKSTAKRFKLSGSKRKQVELKASHIIPFQLLALADKHWLDLEKCLEYPLGPVSWQLKTPHGFLAKTEKSKTMHYINPSFIKGSNCPPSKFSSVTFEKKKIETPNFA